MRRYVKDGIVPAFALWIPADMGYIAGVLAEGLATGSLEVGPTVAFDVPGLGERRFDTHGVVVTGPPVVFTAENVDRYRF